MCRKLTLELSEENRLNSESIQLLKDLQYILQRANVFVSWENGQIVFEWNEKEVIEALNRGAGRKKREIQGMSIEEIQARMKSGDTAENIAKELGISRRTLFRRLKESDENS